VGVLAGLIISVCLKPPRTTAVFILLASALALTPLEVVGERLGLWNGTNLLRMFLGLATGLALPCAMIIPIRTTGRRPLLAATAAAALAGSLWAGWSRPAWLGTTLVLGWITLLICVVWVGFERLGRSHAPSYRKGEAK
jgi:hypothetical protein